MAGIYIPGMDMPRERAVTVIICRSGNVYTDGAKRIGTAVPVPDHGRLGDLDAAVGILERLRDHCENEDMAFALNWAAGCLRDLPTIIPADKEGEG